MAEAPKNTGINIDIKEAEALLLKMGKSFGQLAYIKLVGQSALNWINRNFRQAGIEHKWAPLSPNTIASRRLKGRGGVQILRNNGRLAQSFVSTLTSEPSVSVGTEDPRAKWHNEGTGPFFIQPKNKPLRFMTAKGWRSSWLVLHPGLPRRPLVPSERLAEKMGQNVLEAYIQELTKE